MLRSDCVPAAFPLVGCNCSRLWHDANTLGRFGDDLLDQRHDRAFGCSIRVCAFTNATPSDVARKAPTPLKLRCRHPREPRHRPIDRLGSLNLAADPSERLARPSVEHRHQARTAFDRSTFRLIVPLWQNRAAASHTLGAPTRCRAATSSRNPTAGPLYTSLPRQRGRSPAGEGARERRGGADRLQRRAVAGVARQD
jgi:hypothetical protein